jgi:hypothetical protein
VLRLHVRSDADRFILIAIVSFAISVVGIRWWLQLTGYPQIGGGELHIAHMLWGGLLLVVAGLLPQVVVGTWVKEASAVALGAGTGLFIDEVGKFITTSNDYFYPAAAPLIYGVLLTFALAFILLRRRHAGHAAAPGPLTDIEHRWLPHRRYRRILVAVLGLVGLGMMISFAVWAIVDDATFREAIAAFATQPGDPVKHPTDPLWYGLEASVLAGSGLLLVAGATVLGLGRERAGTSVALVGLSLSLTAGALVSLYVAQVSAIADVLVDTLLLLAVVHFRRRFLDLDGDVGEGMPAFAPPVSSTAQGAEPAAR